VSIDLRTYTASISLCNIYAPNDLQQQLFAQFEYIFGIQYGHWKWCPGGDWNVTLEAVDKKGGVPWKPTIYRDKVVTMMEELHLCV